MNGTEQPATVETTGGWAATSASVRGASHDRSGLPNQDGVGVVAVEGPVPGLVAAVADGHGGARYVRSDVGSRLAVEIAGRAGAEAMASIGASPTAARVERELSGPTITAVVDRWGRAVRDHLATHPFTDEERARTGAPLDGDPLVAYGCTLLVALCAAGWVGLLQVGDGDASVVAADGSTAAPVPGDDRLVGGETTSLCLPTATADARVAALVGGLPALVVLTTDGYANSFAAADWRRQAGADLLAHVRDDGLDEVAARLPSWLADSAVAGGDDVSMALIERRAPAPVGAAGAVAAGARRRSRGGLIAVAVVVAVALAAIGGWALGRSDDGGSERGTSSTTPGPEERATTTTATTEADAVAPTLLLVPLDASGGAELVRFDPVPGAASPEVVATTTGIPVVPELPARWTYEAFALRYRTTLKTTARAVSVVDDVVWAVTADGGSLVAYDGPTGGALGMERIAGRAPEEPDESVGGASGGQAPSPSSSPTTPTTTHDEP